jgi:hypothetical protein
VFANAGISDTNAFPMLAAAPKDGSPPPKPNFKTIDVNFTAVASTIYLAIHYFQQNPSPGGKVVATASASGLYALPYVPVYSATKSGVSPCEAVPLIVALTRTPRLFRSFVLLLPHIPNRTLQSTVSAQASSRQG